MVSAHARVGLIIAAVFLTGLALAAPRLATPDRVVVTLSPAQPVTPLDADRDSLTPGTAPRELELDDPDERLDLYGNPVSDGVAEYRLDSDGSVYELHSPHTELPRLGSPKT